MSSASIPCIISFQLSTRMAHDGSQDSRTSLAPNPSTFLLKSVPKDTFHNSPSHYQFSLLFFLSLRMPHHYTQPVYFFWNKILLCSSGWPGTHYILPQTQSNPNLSLPNARIRGISHIICVCSRVRRPTSIVISQMLSLLFSESFSLTWYLSSGTCQIG